MSDLAIYLLFVLMGGLILILGFFIIKNQEHIFERYDKDYHDYMDCLRKIQRWTFEHGAQSAENDERIINRLDIISYDLVKILNDKNKALLTASDRGKNVEEMFDYKGLIEKGFAIEVPEDNNPYKE